MITEFNAKEYPDVVVKVLINEDDDDDLISVCGGFFKGKQIECRIDKKFANDKKIIDAVNTEFMKRYLPNQKK